MRRIGQTCDYKEETTKETNRKARLAAGQTNSGNGKHEMQVTGRWLSTA